MTKREGKFPPPVQIGLNEGRNATVFLTTIRPSSVARRGGGGAIAPPQLACRPKCRMRKALRF